MKYKCLILDHDDTAVKSSRELHYPAFREIMEVMRPEHRQYTLEEFMEFCFEPGFDIFCMNELNFTMEEMKEEYLIWKKYIKDIIPHFYDGFLDMVRKFKEMGGYICVVSHSERLEIERHYRAHGIELDLVYGWERPREERKPNAYPLKEIMRILNLCNKECIVLDDLKLGWEMAKACEVDFAAAGWSHEMAPKITETMKEISDYYFDTVDGFSKFIFE